MIKLITIMLGLLTLAFVFKETKSPEINTALPTPANNVFITAVMGSGADPDYTNMHNLNVNLWHPYCNINRYEGWVNIGNDVVFEDPVNYAAAINTRIGLNNSNNLLTYYDRPKWDYLAYGQRSDYQCEPIAEVHNS